MNRTLRELLAIAGEVKTVYASYVEAARDGRISIEEGLKLAGDVIAVLDKHKVTIAELKDLLGEIGPLVSLVK